VSISAQAKNRRNNGEIKICFQNTLVLEAVGQDDFSLTLVCLQKFTRERFLNKSALRIVQNPMYMLYILITPFRVHMCAVQPFLLAVSERMYASQDYRCCHVLLLLRCMMRRASPSLLLWQACRAFLWPICICSILIWKLWVPLSSQHTTPDYGFISSHIIHRTSLSPPRWDDVWLCIH